MANSVKESITVETGPGPVWDVIADFEAYPEWQGDIKEVEVLETDDEGWGTRVRFKVDAKIMQAELVLEYEYTETQMRWWLVEGHGVKKNDGVYTVEPNDDGTTEVTYELEVEPAMPVPGMLRRQAARRIVHGALRDMKQRAEELA